MIQIFVGVEKEYGEKFGHYTVRDHWYANTTSTLSIRWLDTLLWKTQQFIAIKAAA